MVDWLLNKEPREAQIEAIRRSYYGEALWDRSPTKYPDERPNPRSLHSGPRKGWGHFMQMRLGKTPTLLNEAALLRRDYDFRWTVVYTPAKFKLDWPLEAGRFGLDVATHAFKSTNHEDAQRFIDKNKTGGLIAVNYEAMRYKKNVAILENLIDDRTLFACDESVNIKNPSSMYTEAALALSKQAGCLRILSGKPCVHSPYDYWSQLRFIHELDGFNQFAFRNTFVQMGGFKGKQMKGPNKDPAVMQRLYDILDACSWAPRRVDWMTTHNIDYVERLIRLPDEQVRMYREMQNDFLTQVGDKVISADQIVGKLLKMQQISSGFIYDEFKKPVYLVESKNNVKAQEVNKILSEELPDNEKMLVFTCFIPSYHILMEALAAFNPAGIWPGQTDEELIAEKHRFNNDPSCRVWISNSKSVKYGNTLMGTETHPCTTMLFYENWYSLDDRAQCEERPQGQGQVGDLTVIDLMCTQHDRAPIRALQRKEDVSAACMRYDRATGLLPPKPEPTRA